VFSSVSEEKIARIIPVKVKSPVCFSVHYTDCTAFDPTTAQSTTIKRFSFSHVPPTCFGLNMVVLREASNKGIQEWQGLLHMCTCGVKNEMFSNRIAKSVSNTD
jgi:hypothetical protein